MRCSTALRLPRAGVDVGVIRQWLGRASVTATNRYASIDLETKAKKPPNSVKATAWLSPVRH
jgi:site-specific recombinase XerD